MRLKKKNVKERESEIVIYYFTDPICSFSWATEPKIRRLQEEYDGRIHIVYKMGGLMEKWSGYEDPETSIRRPSQMAPRWANVAKSTGMPIDERIWREDPPLTTYPACIAFKAAQFQGPKLAVRYLRNLQEAVFLERKNTSREKVLLKLAEQVGLNKERFTKDFKEGKAESAFRQDLEEGREQFILGYPTLLFRGAGGREAKLYGIREYNSYQQAIDDVHGSPVKRNQPKSIISFIRRYERVLIPEVAETFRLEKDEAKVKLETLRKEKKVRSQKMGNGEQFWMPA